MKRLFIFIISATLLQACTFGHYAYNRYIPRNDRNNPAYYDHNSTYGYDIPVSPTNMAYNIEKQPAWGHAGYDCGPDFARSTTNNHIGKTTLLANHNRDYSVVKTFKVGVTSPFLFV